MAFITNIIDDGSTGHHYFQLDIFEDNVDIANNKSTISWNFLLYPKQPNYDWRNWGTKIQYSVTVNGETTTGTIPAYDGTSEIILASKSGIEISHNNDGEKSIAISFSVNSSGYTQNYLPGTAAADGTATLTKIPRNAKITKTPTSFTDEANPVIEYSNPAGDKISHLQACISWTGGADIAYRDIVKTDSSYTFYLTDAERKKLRQAVTAADGKLAVNFFVWSITADGNEKRDYLPSIMQLVDYLPEITVTAVDTNSKATGLTGNGNTKIIKGFNNIEYAITANVKKEATVSSYSAVCGSKSGNTASGTLVNVEADTITFTIIDSRGNKAEDTKSFTMVNYIPITVNQKVEAVLTGETTAQLNVTLTGNFFSGNFGAANNNFHYAYHLKKEGEDWQTWVGGYNIPDFSPWDNSYTLEFSIPDLAYDKSYTIVCMAEDSVYTRYTPEYVVSVTPVFDWSKDDFNFNVPVSIQGDTINDFVIETGTDAMGSNGIWYWRKWKSGRAECYGKRNYGNMGVSTAWGNWYESASFRQSLPSGLFAAAPEVVEANVVSGGGAGFITFYTTDLSASSTGSFTVCRPTSQTLSQVYIGFNVIGRWK